ncbi:MAG: UDP-glucose/GDP-mannose dehydrogenase family protein [Desulfobacteraceae bacterium]|nr:UDP-glucose/GDP-mannose dehydrogenase family protein [Desulfobacteraceae bacterium]
MQLCIIGTGYVGLVTAACFTEMGNDVCCVDINPEVIRNLNNGKIHIYEPGLEQLVKRNVTEKRLKFTTDLSEGLENALFVMSCVGTPSNPDGSCDLSYVLKVAEQIGESLNEYKIIINKSTVPVGTADTVKQIIKDRIEKRKLSIEFDVVSNPEFLKEGDAVNDFMKPDRIIVGTDNVRTAKLLETLYAPFARSRDKMIVMSVRSAELTKYAANCMLATKISFINEIANICDRVGADVADIRLGIGSDQRIGYHFIYPGAGYGGSCFPKDVRALINTAKEKGYNPSLLSAVDHVNGFQKKVLSGKIKAYFEDQGGVSGKTLAVWGIAFKANTDDIRESAAVDIIKELAESGMKIRAYDPEAGTRARNELASVSNLSILDDQYEVLNGADALAVATDWNQFRNPNFSEIKKRLSAPLIFDGRNLYSPDYVTSQGFAYFCIGRPKRQ